MALIVIADLNAGVFSATTSVAKSAVSTRGISVHPSAAHNNISFDSPHSRATCQMTVREKPPKTRMYVQLSFYIERISFILIGCLGFVTDSQDIANQIYHSEASQAGVRKMGIEGGLYLSPHAGEFFQGGVLSPCGPY